MVSHIGICLALLAAFGSVVLAAPVNSLGATLAQLECTPAVPFHATRNGYPGNCARALVEGFPNGATIGQFHQGGPNNDFRLPRSHIVGDCQVTVDLNGVTSVQGSWLEVWTMANTMSTACTYYRSQQYPATAVTGGYIFGGQGNGLAVMLNKPMALASNETAHTTE